jgi:predicted nucleic acid-binding protein
MSVVAFDNTMLSILLNPDGNVPEDKITKLPVTMARERAELRVQLLQKQRQKIVLPTPACAELLTAIGPDAQQYVNTVSRSRVFEIVSFDARCAAELALLNRDTFAAHDKKNSVEPYQKVKFDRQIVAICKVAGATEIYTDDDGLAKRARLCGITPIGIADLPLPETSPQMTFDLEPHDDIASVDEQDAKPEKPAG